MKELSENADLQLLLNDFNNKEFYAFEHIYDLLYKDLYYFTNSLYKNTVIDYKDIIQDIFLEVWRNTRKFDSILGLKTFLFVVIRNKFRMYYKHQKVVGRVNSQLMIDDDLFTVQAAEAEIFSIIPTALNLLPKECGRVLRLFLEGYDVSEIAEMVGKQPSTIYRQRNDAIEILRRKLSKDKFILFMSYLIKINVF